MLVGWIAAVPFEADLTRAVGGRLVYAEQLLSVDRWVRNELGVEPSDVLDG